MRLSSRATTRRPSEGWSTSHVFNAAQVDNAPAAGPPATTDALPIFDRFVADTGATIREGGTHACYVPASDSIHLPDRAAFVSAAARATTLAHELAHWTGATHRLARNLAGRFGSHAYAAEELVAELGAAFVLAALGLARHPHPEHAAYVAGWLPLLRDDPRALATAAAHGSRAADFLLALSTDPEPSAPPAGLAHDDARDDVGTADNGVITTARPSAA